MTSLLAADAACARGAVADVMGVTLQCVGALGFGYAVAFMCDWRVALLVTALLPVLVSGGIIQTRYMLGTATGGQAASEDEAAAATAVGEALASIHVVQAYNLQVWCGAWLTLLHLLPCQP
jgi:ATP-binding cassette subfamily B (MDR/TAP) protein 1